MLFPGVTDEQNLAVIQSIVAAGFPERILKTIDGYEPNVEQALLDRNTKLVAEELHRFGITEFPYSTVFDVITLRALMMPTVSGDLALAIDRLFVYAGAIDDVVSAARELTPIRMAASLAQPPPDTPHADYVRHMFTQFAPYCSPTFLGSMQMFLGRAALGALFETCYADDASDLLATSYVRDMSGYSEYYYAVLSVIDPCLNFERNLQLWGTTIPPMIDFLIDLNDVTSFYKEALNGSDLRNSKIYRVAVREGIPYLDSFQRSLTRGMQAYEDILAAADDNQRPFLKDYLDGYIYWHTHVLRYGWDKVVPGTPMITPGQ